MPTLIYILECVAIICASASAALLAIKKRMDVIGTLLMALIASFGGGIMRDVSIGKMPISLLSEPSYVVLVFCVIGTVAVIFHLGFIPKARDLILKQSREFWFDFTDALGLAAFAISGADVAAGCVQSDAIVSEIAVQIFAGCITGVGGGILRDVIASDVPLIFKKHVYILPVVFGTTAYVLLQTVAPKWLAVAVGMTLIIGLRVLAIIYKWNLPTPLGKEPKNATEEKIPVEEKV